MANKPKDVKDIPAGINDNFEVCVMGINNIIELSKASKKYKKVLKVNNAAKRDALSTDLYKGMSIALEDNQKIDIQKLIDFKERKAELENRHRQEQEGYGKAE